MTSIITKCGNVEWPKFINNITDNNIAQKYLSKQLDTQI